MNESLSVGASHLAYGVSLRGALYCENGHEKAGHGWNENVSANLPQPKPRWYIPTKQEIIELRLRSYPFFL